MYSVFLEYVVHEESRQKAYQCRFLPGLTLEQAESMAEAIKDHYAWHREMPLVTTKMVKGVRVPYQLPEAVKTAPWLVTRQKYWSIALDVVIKPHELATWDPGDVRKHDDYAYARKWLRLQQGELRFIVEAFWTGDYFSLNKVWVE